MFRYILVIGLIIGSIQFAIQYLTSEKFQAYGDRSEAQWTCWVNDFLGEFYIVLSQYDESLRYYQRSLERCKEGPVYEKTRFQIAYCYEKEGNKHKAVALYQKFQKDFPDSKRSANLPTKILRIKSRF